MRKNQIFFCVIFMIISFQISAQVTAVKTPPYDGTIWKIIPSVLCDVDDSVFKDIKFTKKEKRKYPDRRVANFYVKADINIYTATFTDGTSLEFELNTEFDSKKAMALAKQYAIVFGRIPKALRDPLESVTINGGNEAFSGVNKYFGADRRNVLVHTTQGEKYIKHKIYGKSDILAETIIHEAVHACLDDLYYLHDVDGVRQIRKAYKDAMDADGVAISTYARGEPKREDMAESFLPWLALRYRSERLSEEQKKTIKDIMPKRLELFDKLKLDMSPMKKNTKYNVVEDKDGNYYRTVKIGTQTWMAENIKVTQCNNGTKIPRANLDQKTTTMNMYWHGNSPTTANSKTYGPLYNWPAVRDCNVCPTGWSVPTQDQWNMVLRYWYGKNGVQSGAPGLTYAAYQLREKGNAHWPNNGKATNSTGFTALPGGWVTTSSGNFSYFGTRTAWWAKRDNAPLATKIAEGDNGIWTAIASTKDIMYVRCIKNPETKSK